MESKRISPPDTAYIRCVNSLLLKLSECIGEGGDDRINIILTGGVAVHVYVNSRVSRDVDVLFDRPVSVPPGLSAVYSAPEGDMVVGMDQGMVRLVSLLHPDYGAVSSMLRV